MHIASLLASGGLALAADRAVIRTTAFDVDGQANILSQLSLTHRPVGIALVISFSSGAALFLADVEAFAVMRQFWIKMALILLLLTNALLMMRQERRLNAMRHDVAAKGSQPSTTPPLWARLRRHAWASMSLWFAIVLAGTAMTSA